MRIIPYCLIIFVSLIGNSLVLAVVFKNPRMRTTVSNYIVNLAVTDLLITFYMPRVISLALFGYDPPQPSANDCLCIYCSSHQFWSFQCCCVPSSLGADLQSRWSYYVHDWLPWHFVFLRFMLWFSWMKNEKSTAIFCWMWRSPKERLNLTITSTCSSASLFLCFWLWYGTQRSLTHSKEEKHQVWRPKTPPITARDFGAEKSWNKKFGWCPLS